MSPASSGSGVRVPIDLGPASGDSAEGRAFYQERLGIFGGWVLFLSFGFYAAPPTQETITVDLADRVGTR